jgi:hypothetical protein
MGLWLSLPHIYNENERTLSEGGRRKRWPYSIKGNGETRIYVSILLSKR